MGAGWPEEWRGSRRGRLTSGSPFSMLIRDHELNDGSDNQRDHLRPKDGDRTTPFSPDRNTQQP